MTIDTLKQIYEIDEERWLAITIDLLKQKQFDELDLENLIEELESLGRSDKNAVESFLEQIIRHLLLLQYWTEEYERNSGHWEAELLSFRKQLNRRLTTSLHNYLISKIDLIYQDALEYVRKKTQDRIEFPQECPYTLEQLLSLNEPH
jgi:hypothetical protein